MDKLKKQTSDELMHFLHNKNLVNIVVEYLVMTSAEFIQIHKDAIIAKYKISNVISIKCNSCIFGKTQHYLDGDSICRGLNPSVHDLCDDCMPFVICETSEHLEDFKQHQNVGPLAVCYDRYVIRYREYHFNSYN